MARRGEDVRRLPGRRVLARPDHAHRYGEDLDAGHGVDEGRLGAVADAGRRRLLRRRPGRVGGDARRPLSVVFCQQLPRTPSAALRRLKARRFVAARRHRPLLRHRLGLRLELRPRRQDRRANVTRRNRLRRRPPQRHRQLRPRRPLLPRPRHQNPRQLHLLRLLLPPLETPHRRTKFTRQRRRQQRHPRQEAKLLPRRWRRRLGTLPILRKRLF
mmetsp:Transcript_1018/g.3468  ORF Transcript_1018/g.3468 Transcript_1018/m.3468 type:complete len:215 (+) Transcript_1018:703-1347(+)